MSKILCFQQRWSPRERPWPRGHILKSLALASKVKSLALASRPQVLENWPVLGSRTAVFFELLKFCGALEKFFRKRFFVEIAWKIYVKTFFFFGDRLKNFCEDLFFFLETTCACVLGPWPRAFLSLASRVSVLGKAVLGLGLEPCVLDSTSGFQMGLNMSEMWFNGIKIAFFSKKLQKIAHQLGASPPETPKASGRWGPAPRPPSAIRLSYTGFLKTSPKLHICTFQLY